MVTGRWRAAARGAQNDNTTCGRGFLSWLRSQANVAKVDWSRAHSARQTATAVNGLVIYLLVAGYFPLPLSTTVGRAAPGGAGEGRRVSSRLTGAHFLSSCGRGERAAVAVGCTPSMEASRSVPCGGRRRASVRSDYSHRRPHAA